MARMIVLLFVLFLVSATPLPSHQPEAPETHASANQPNSSPSPVPRVSKQGSTERAAKTGNQDSYSYYYPAAESQSPPVWFQVVTTIILLFFTAGLWLTSIWQWKAIGRQAKAAEDTLIETRKAADAAKLAVDAAKENLDLQKALTDAAIKSAEAAEAALHANRPFLLVTKLHSERAKAGYWHLIYVHMKNFGISPADIRDYTINVWFLDAPNPPGSWELIPPWYGPDEGSPLTDPMVMSGEAIQRVTIAVEVPPYMERDVAASKTSLVIHGRVRYRGMPNREYVTGFCWLYRPHEAEQPFYRPFPQRYNRYT